MEWFFFNLEIIIAVSLLALGFVAGKLAEKRHYRSIRDREKLFLDQPAVSFRTPPDLGPIESAHLAVGSVVISVDYYKRLLMAFRRIFGGEVRSYSPLIDRGRREALLRMKEQFPDADLYCNCRLETSTIYSGKGKAIGCVEIVAYATAVTYAKLAA